MKNKKELPKLGKKGTVAGLVLSFVAMITLVGAYTFTKYQSDVENELAELDLVEEQEMVLDDIIQDDAQETNTDQISNEEDTEEDVDDTEEISEIDTEETANENVTSTNETIAEQVTFNESSNLVWPVNGGIIMMYSMEDAIYFQTLDQYKLNPAMVIEGEVGTEVLAGERGTVESITEEADTGVTVTINMGSGYTAVYGQLDELKVSEGSYVEKGQVIGVLAEPTKYYSLEGCNLYFQVLKDGEPVDPLEYLTN